MPDVLDCAFDQLTATSPQTEAGALYAYQRAVAEALLAGRRVVVRAPAGAGKSLAAWLPWLVGRDQSYDMPPTLFHAVPGGIFVGDLIRQLRACAGTAQLAVRIETEGDAFDPFLLADAIFTTVDHLLSIALHRPLGLHPGLANINAGALLGSYLVFDEFPALASRDMLVLWLGLLRRYYPTVPCLFTSAVLPRPLLARMAEALDAEFIDAGAHVAGGRRTWHALPALSPEAILRQHRGRTIIVCNTVRGAQMLYRQLRQVLEAAGSADELLLLHQYQFHRDRQPIEARASALFGSAGDGQALLVTTSGIKIGADLSAETLITDPSHPDVLLRRAGRCARFAGQQGRVLVARVTTPAPDAGYRAPAPAQLLAHLTDAGPLTTADELAALDRLWAEEPADRLPAAVRALPADAELDAAPEKLLAGSEAFPPRLFSRVGVCLHRMPETVRDPFELERFSLATSSLERGWRQWTASGAPGEWFALIPHWPTGGQQAPTWSPVADPAEFLAATRLVVLNAEATSYDPILGLELAPGAAYQSEALPAQHTAWSPFHQHAQSYEEHAACALAACDALGGWHRYVLRHLARHWQISAVELEQVLRLAILWHDAGKLTADWQRAAQRWQTAVMRRPAREAVIGRIDFDPARHGAFPCPPHAPASGQVVSKVFATLLPSHEPLLTGTLAALCHHHGSDGNAVDDLTPHPEAWETLMQLAAQVVDARELRRLDRAGWATHTRGGLSAVADHPPAQPDAWMAYSFVVRAIRLADREVALDRVFA